MINLFMPHPMGGRPHTPDWADNHLPAEKGRPYTTGGVTYVVYFTSARVSQTAPRPGYRVVTARIYHIGGVNALFIDVRVRFARSVTE